MLNGDGLRTVLWVSGCAHHCRGCQNPQTWDACSGIPFDDAAKKELFADLSRDYMSGVTFSGGDPLCPGNRETVGQLIAEIHERFPEKTIWLYTGDLFESFRDTLSFLPMIDVIVDARGCFSTRLRTGLSRNAVSGPASPRRCCGAATCWGGPSPM